jgi:hypothetical protein
MAGEENLKPFNTLTVEEQREIAKKGAQASIKVRREKKELKERIALALEYITKEKSKQAQTEELKKTIEAIGYDTFIVLKEIEKGNLTAIDRFWDRLYGKPIQQVEDLTKEKVTKIDIKIIEPKNETGTDDNKTNDEEPKQPSKDND